MKVYMGTKGPLEYFIFCKFPLALSTFKELGITFKESIYSDPNATARELPNTLFWRRVGTQYMRVA